MSDTNAERRVDPALRARLTKLGFSDRALGLGKLHIERRIRGDRWQNRCCRVACEPLRRRSGSEPCRERPTRLNLLGFGRADRKSVVLGKSVSVRVELGGGRLL